MNTLRLDFPFCLYYAEVQNVFSLHKGHIFQLRLFDDCNFPVIYFTVSTDYITVDNTEYEI